MSAIRLAGELRADAQSRIDTQGTYLLMLDVLLPHEPPGNPVQVRAVKSYGTGPAAGLACAARARQLRRGVQVVITAAALRRVRGRIEVAHLEDAMAPDLHIPMGGADR